jgi:hypothetical protein
MLNRNATAFMRRGMRLSRIACSFCLAAAGLLLSVPASAQAPPPKPQLKDIPGVPSEFSLSGTWVPYFHEDLLERGNGPELDNYLGIPITNGVRKMALSWDPSRMTVEEHQCQVHVSPYMNRSPSRYAFWEERDPETQRVIAIKLYIENYQQTRTIWMDGRAHPPDYAPHTWMGFSTGKWEGNVLTVYTTHIKQGFIRRNGIAESDRATMVEHYIRYGDIMTDVVILTDPVYLTEPFIKTNDFALAQYTPGSWVYSCEPVEELDAPKNRVPHYLPGQNPFVDEFAKKRGIPLDAAMGGAETMYPEYQLKLEEMMKAQTQTQTPAKK